MIRMVLAILIALAAAPASARVEVEDSRGAQVFEAPPERAVALSWSLAEQLLERETLDKAELAAVLDRVRPRPSRGRRPLMNGEPSGLTPAQVVAALRRTSPAEEAGVHARNVEDR